MTYLPDIHGPDDTRKLTLEQLEELAEEVRQEIVSNVSQTGGHLASNLGSTELTIALHYVFNPPTDRIIWDVSHQTYAHKILTGRREQMPTLRQYGGLSGYAKRTESDYDHFGAGHASTSISAAMGFAVARDMAGLDHKVIAVIGDGAMTGGLAFEGLNNAGSQRKNILVILNDNTWSISRNVGAISRYLTGIMADEKFNRLRKEVWELTGRFKRRDKIRETVARLEKSLKGLLVPGMLFERLGFRYFGPIDGHDVQLLVKTLNDVKNISGPVLLHVATIKGKGYEPAEEDAFSYHGVGKFDKVTGKAAKSASLYPAYTKVFGNTMVEIGAAYPRVVAITAAMTSGTGLTEFADTYPDRFYDVGIAEAHAACFAAGLAAEGMKPFLTVYSTFMQRAYDQVIHDMAIQNLPVVICMDRAGLVGNDGPTHHGNFDLSYLSAVPGATIAAPRDGNELRSMMHYAACHDFNGLVAIRYPRDSVPTLMTDDIEPIDWGTWEWMTDASDVVVLAVGAMVKEMTAALDMLNDQGLKITLVNARFIKPLDLTSLEWIRENAGAVITVEENAPRGGFGEAIGSYLIEREFSGRFHAITLPDRFVTHGARSELLREVGLDAASLASKIAARMPATRKPTGRLFQKLGLRRNGRKRDLVRDYSATGTDTK